MLNLLKENYVLQAHLPHSPSSLTNDHHVWFFGLVLCVDWNASYSSQVAYVTCRLCPNQWIILLKNRVLCYKNSNINVVINNSTYLFQSQLWSIVTSSGSAFHNINITCSVTKTFSATNYLCFDTITDIMLLLLLRNHSEAFRHRKCLIPLAPPCDYSWHGTTPGPQRSWAESRRLLLARDYSWPVTPVTCVV